MQPKFLLAAVVAATLISDTGTAHGQWFRRRQSSTVRTVPTAPAKQTPAQSTPPKQEAQRSEPVEAPGDIPQDAKWEILRMGDRVQEVGTGHGGIEQLFAAAVAAPPEDDSYKWYISVVTRPGCTACSKLLTDFRRSDALKCFANPDDFTTSWSHFNVYDSTDQTQTWRWAKVKISAYPTIILQPPLNRKFGDPKTVVLQHTGYDGNPAALAEEFRKSIRYYVERMHETRSSGMQSEEPSNPIGDPSGPPAPEIGADPPFSIPLPKPLDTIIPDTGPPQIPNSKPTTTLPESLASLASLWTLLAVGKWIVSAVFGLLAGGGLTNLLLLFLLILAAVRTLRTKSKWLELLIDDATLVRLGESIRAVMPKAAPITRLRPETTPTCGSAATASDVRTSPAPRATQKKTPGRTVQRAKVVMRN